MSVLGNVWRFYRDGFAQMTIGKTLWGIILLKLIFMFLVLKLFFFQGTLSKSCDTNEEKADYVAKELIGK